MKTPVLFLIFNRPLQTERVFEEIRKAKPARLFIAADGPRESRPDDVIKCRETRDIVCAVDWPCEVKILFRQKNLGCKMAVSSAIDWFFQNVEEGIILEDDCLPDHSFFRFCGEMLEKYRKEEKVMMVGGSNSMGSWNTGHSYFFSKYARLWGWATWKRVWAAYDVKMTSWADNSNKETVKIAVGGGGHWKEKKWVYDQVFTNKKDTWDYQMEYLLLVQNGLSVVPSVNLIRNIGFGSNATHTFKEVHGMSLERQAVAFPLSYPAVVEADKKYDNKLAPKRLLAKMIFWKLFRKK